MENEGSIKASSTGEVLFSRETRASKKRPVFEKRMSLFSTAKKPSLHCPAGKGYHRSREGRAVYKKSYYQRISRGKSVDP